MKLRPTFSVAAAICAVATLYACRKPPPDEVVYTGATASPPGTSQSSGGTGGGGAPAVDAAADAGGGSATTFQGIGGTAPQIQFSKQALLAQISECALAYYREFDQRTLTLDTAARELVDEPSASTKTREAWSDAMALWQQLELLRFGPAASASAPGGQDLRDHIYSWPLISRCKIEEQLVDQTYTEPGFAGTLINGRTLWASEYLLFFQGTDNACSKFSPINASNTWAALTEAELDSRKRRYAAAVVADVRQRAVTLRNAWEPTAGDFGSNLKAAGASGSVFSGEQQALNAVSDALFYLDKEMKDLKLGRPAGINECLSASCPEAVESPFAQQSLVHVKNNLLGFRRLFQGCYADGSGLGFDDWLVAVGAGELAQRMQVNLDSADTVLASTPSPLELTVVVNPPAALAAHAALKRLTDDIKTQFVTVLNLELPKTVEGDND